MRRGSANGLTMGTPAKDGLIASERLSFLIGKRCTVRVWWAEEGRAATPGADVFRAVMVNVVPVGRDYYFVFDTGTPSHPRRSIIKTAAVLEVTEEPEGVSEASQSEPGDSPVVQYPREVGTDILR